ncbi:MAG: alpha/beta hydrolase [Candidatus Brocadiia bacterium]
MLWMVVGAVAALYLSLVAAVWFLQDRLVYFPSRLVAQTPDRVGLAYEEVALHTADGVELAAWFVPAQDARGVALFCHGNAGNISDRLDTLGVLHRVRLSALLFDYRGYGESQGRPSEEGTYRDAEAAWRYLVERRMVSPHQIVVFGRSLGGAVATWLAREQTPRALVLESAFTSVPDIARKHYWFLPVELVCRFEYDTLDHLGGVRCPVLIVHSAEDELVPESHGRRLFQAAPGPKRFLEITGSHNEGFRETGQVYIDGLDAFLTEVLGR